jgi:hypothetical protein
MAELAEQIKSIELDGHSGILDAKLFFDRGQIEAQAQELINNRESISEPEVSSQEYKDNARTAIMEALTASGHLSTVILEGRIEEIEAQLLGRLLNGWDESLPNPEKDRRFAEICNVIIGQKTRLAIIEGGLPENTAMLEVSDYPESLAGKNLGYRDKNKKGMVRSSHLESKGEDQYRLVIEQASRSNGTSSSTFPFMDACGIKRPVCFKADDLVTLETPLIYSRHDYADGVIDVLRHLDSHAGAGTLYGDIDDDTKAKHISYSDLREESIRREAEIDNFTDNLAKSGEQLDELVKAGRLTLQESKNIFDLKIENILEAICTHEPSYAQAAFGDRAAPAFYEAAIFAARGRIDRAAQVLNSSYHLREKPVYCGGGSSSLNKKAEELGIELDDYINLVGDAKKNWVWRDGVCVVKTCDTRPRKTEVGPCSICRKCQKKFDRGEDPTKHYISKIGRKRGEHLSIDRKETGARIGRILLSPNLKLKRGEHQMTAGI